jgi:hypothetical protein
LAPHPALHKSRQAVLASAGVCHGDGMVVPRGRYRVVITDPGLNSTTCPS